MNILLTISYDGTNYCGWQFQHTAISVQQKVEEALCKLIKENITLYASGRTDACVHALGQKANFHVKSLNIPIDKIPYAIKRYMPEDIVILKSELVDDNFNARYNSIEKTYEYKILNSSFPIPTLRNYTWFVKKNLNVEKMCEASLYIIGTHDFSAFTNLGSSAKTTVRTIFSIDIFENQNLISIVVRGNGFLYNMVRIIVGTLVSVGLGKFQPDQVKIILESKKRNMAGKTAPPGGLTLVEVLH